MIEHLLRVLSADSQAVLPGQGVGNMASIESGRDGRMSGRSQQLQNRLAFHSRVLHVKVGARREGQTKHLREATALLFQVCGMPFFVLVP